MLSQCVAKAQVLIEAPPEKVWEALTDPEHIRQYLHGTEVTTDWKVGSPIRYRGEWQGKAYEDKGRVVEVIKYERLVTSFWSSLSGLPDLPEHYKTVIFDLAELDGGGTLLTLTQDNNASREEADHSRGNWRAVLEKLREVLEKELSAA